MTTKTPAPPNNPQASPGPNTGPPPSRFTGCDVGKHSIVVFDSQRQRTTTIANHPDDRAAFAGTLDATCLVVREATGGHEATLLAAMVQAGQPAHRADARRVKAFIRSFGTLGKTDAIDAQALARYGAERHARLLPRQPPDTHRDDLQALVLVRQDGVAQRTAGANRLSAPGGKAAKSFLEQQLAFLKAQADAIEALIQQHEPLERAQRILCEVPGIGATTAAALLAPMPELGSLHRRQAAALAGPAPHPKQSGNADAYRQTKGGRPEIKQALFMAALSAARCNPDLKIFHDRLIANGKKKLVALGAMMRKPVIIRNAMPRPEQATTEIATQNAI